MKIYKLLAIIISVTLINSQSIISKADEISDNIIVDKISKNLRCLICQGQSVYDSQSDFALSIKLLIKKKIKEGKTEIEIYEFLKIKYGEWIVYDPEFNKNTLFLWLFPLVLFIFGGFLIIRKAFIN
tara:strand:+ start:7649 stop:8029 length:381 start_codon:yes stop_codon:yes gene_type:complete